MTDVRNLHYRFDDVDIDVQNLRVTVGSELRPLEPKSFRLLLLLVENSGLTLGKDQIMAAVWPDASVSDNSLARAITQVRKALGDDSKSPRYIQTVPTIGYRFVADCTRTEAPAAQGPANPTSPSPITTEPIPPVRHRLPGWAVAAGCVALAGGISLAGFFRRPSTPTPLRVASASKLTSYPGDEREPAISPDGSLVAFSWSGPAGDNYDIYVLKPGAAQPLRLTHDPAPDGFPAWSPDGGQISFVRRLGDAAQLVVVPALGGPERVLRQFPRMGADLDFSQHPVMTWTSDGASIIYSGQSGTGEKYRLFALAVATGELRPISTPSPGDVGDSSPALSPDGRFLAFVRYIGPRNGRLMVQPLNPGLVPAGPPMEIKTLAPSPRSPVWLDNGHRLLFADQNGIFQWDRDHGAVQIYASDGTLMSASLSPIRAGGQQLAVDVERADPDIWETPLNAQGLKAIGPPVVVVQSTANDSHPDFSPDGRSMTFVSLRSGTMEVWLADADGSNPRQLTHLGAHITSYPRWSPDGTKIAFHARVPDVAEVYVVDVDKGAPKQITHENPGLAVTTWSRDGSSLYASTLAGGHATNYRFPAGGGGPVERMWDGAFVKESVDGRYALYWKPDQSGIFRRSLAGDPTKNPEELLVSDFSPANQWGGYEPVAGGVYYVSGDAQGRPGPFRYFDYASRKSIDVAPPAPGLRIGFAVAPDRRHIAFTATSEMGGDLLLLDLR